MSLHSEGRTVAELAALVGGRVVRGDGGQVYIKNVASIENGGAGTIAFVEDKRRFTPTERNGHSCLIVAPGEWDDIEAACIIEAERPKLAFARIAEALHLAKRQQSSIHPTAIVAASAELGPGVFLGAHVRIGEQARIGAGSQIHQGAFLGDDVRVGIDCVIHPNAVLYDGVRLGERVILHAGVVIGADGFGYVRGAAGYHKFPQIGDVVIEDDVEIGANACIDRGALGETRIGHGTKIDNLVHIAHNVRIGARVVIAAQTGISGSSVIEDDAVIGGQVGIGDHVRVGRGAVIGSKAGVLPGKIVRAGAVVWGVPVRPLDEYKRLNAYWGRLPQMHAEIKELHRRIEELIKRLDEKP